MQLTTDSISGQNRWLEPFIAYKIAYAMLCSKQLLCTLTKWRVSFSLLRETVETFVTFGEMENYLQTVEEDEEVAVWHSAGTDTTRLVLDTRVYVIGLFERRFKDRKFQKFLFRFCFVFGENTESRIYHSIHLEKNHT